MIPLSVWSQIGGALSFQFLNLTNNARSAALSGNSISLADGDLSQVFNNPATLDSVPNGHLFLLFNPYFADAKNMSLAYKTSIKNQPVAFGIRYLTYGNFQAFDETGQVLGAFSANDYKISASTFESLGPFSLGLNLGFIGSQVEGYSASALVADIGGIFRFSDNATVAITFSNLGVVLSSYYEKQQLPIDVRLGLTFKPEYMPFRFTITSSNLTNRNLREEQMESVRTNQVLIKTLKRINFGTELILSHGFQLLFGYNFKKARELRLRDRSAGAGISYGIMVRFGYYRLRFSREVFHAAGGTNFISLQTNFTKKKTIL